jgi:DNA-binding transcriptional ArsR family regulator
MPGPYSGTPGTIGELVATYVSFCLTIAMDTAMDSAVRAIAEPRRREILRLVRERELSAGEIASRFDVTRPAVSQHIAVLRDAGLLSERRDGTRRLYRARPEGMAGLREFLEDFWSDRLERLKLAAELEQQRRKAPKRRRSKGAKRKNRRDRRT